MMKICLVNVSDVDEAMRSRLRVWRNSEKVSPFFLLDQVLRSSTGRGWKGTSAGRMPAPA